MTPDEYKSLIADLRTREESEVYEVVCRMLETGDLRGLEIARRVLKKPKYFAELLDHGLRKADASEVGHWIDACLPPLGVKRTLQVATRVASTDSEAAARMLYKLLPRVWRVSRQSGPELLQLAQMVGYHDETVDAIAQHLKRN